MQGTQVQALVREDPTCRGATKPVCHNYWACALELANHNYWSPRAYSPCSATREATATRSPHTATKSSPRSLQLEKACPQQRRPKADKNKINKINKLKKKKRKHHVKWKSQSQKATYCMIPFIWNVHRERNGKWLLNGYEVSIWADENVLQLDCGNI